MEHLAREKISLQQRLAVLKKDVSLHYDNVDFTKLLPDVASSAQVSNTSTDTIIHSSSDAISLNHSNGTTSEKVIPILAKTNIPVTQTQASIKEVISSIGISTLFRNSFCIKCFFVIIINCYIIFKYMIV